MQPPSHSGYKIYIHNASIWSPGMGRPWCLWWPLLVSHRTYAKRLLSHMQTPQTHWTARFMYNLHDIVLHVLFIVSVVSVVWMPKECMSKLPPSQKHSKHYRHRDIKCDSKLRRDLCTICHACVSTCACNHTSHTHTPKTPCTHQRHHVTTQQTPKRLCTAHARAQILTYIDRHIYRLCRLCPKQTADSTSTMDSRLHKYHGQRCAKHACASNHTADTTWGQL